MNLDSLSLALSQISILVANLTKKNYKQSVGEVARVSTFLEHLCPSHPMNILGLSYFFLIVRITVLHLSPTSRNRMIYKLHCANQSNYGHLSIRTLG